MMFLYYLQTDNLKWAQHFLFFFLRGHEAQREKYVRIRSDRLGTGFDQKPIDML